MSGKTSCKVVILVGGNRKGSMYRPMSLDTPTPLVQVAGKPMIYHHLEACTQALDTIQEVLLIGFYDPSQFDGFIDEVSTQLGLSVRYLQEERALGTAGGVNYFRKEILSGDPDFFLLFHCDIACKFPITELLELHHSHSGCITIMARQIERDQTQYFGGLVIDDDTNQVLHYAEKSKLVKTDFINCGVYACNASLFDQISRLLKERDETTSVSPSAALLQDDPEFLRLEQDVLFSLSGMEQVYAYVTTAFWMQIKTGGAALAAAGMYLDCYAEQKPQLLAAGKEQSASSSDSHDDQLVFDCSIKGNNVIAQDTVIDSTAVIGPNVCIGKGVTIGKGVRLRNCVVGDNSVIDDRAVIQYALLGQGVQVGKWSRLEGSYTGISTTKEGITLAGANVQVDPELVLRDCIILPDIHITSSYQNEIVL